MSTVTGWTGSEARELRRALRLSVRAFAQYLGVAVRTVSKWEAGGGAVVPRPDTQAVLDTALRMADADSQQRFAQLCSDRSWCAMSTHRSQPGTEVEYVARSGSVELLESVGRTDLPPGTLDDIERTVAQLAIDYFVVPPREFRLRALRRRHDVVGWIARRTTLRERRKLYSAAGALTGLLAESSLAAGLPAGEHCAAALALAQEAGDTALAGWVRGTQAQVALFAGDPRDAAGLAEAGCRISPVGSAALVRSQTYLARAAARDGDVDRMRSALRAADQASSSVASSRPDSIFSLSPGYLAACEMTALVWSGEPHAARRHADTMATTGAGSTPTVGRAIARLDLGIALAQTGEAEEAAGIGLQAASICEERMTVPAARRAQELLSALGPHRIPAVIELERRWAWSSESRARSRS